MAHPYREVVGVIHVHSTYSDGTLPVEGIARIAEQQGLDYVILTDHDTLQGRRDGKEGLHGKTLVIADTEISTGAGHLLALRLKEEVPPRRPAGETVRAVSEQGGLGFIAHATWRKRPWRDPEIGEITGLEIYDLASDVSDEFPVSVALAALLAGPDISLPRWVDRPKDLLALWDRLLAGGRRVVGIGSGDAHGLQWFGFRLGPYSTVFKLVRNHLLIRGELTAQAAHEAIEKGRLFVAHDVFADARGFLFLAENEGAVQGVMGDEVRISPGLRLYSYLPSPGRMTLFRNGKEVARAEGQHGWFEVAGPGAYRLEAARRGRPWIYSNPIYVLE